MEKILVVCNYSWETVKKLAEKYPHILWICNTFLSNEETSEVIIQLVRLVDKIMFLGEDNKRIAYEVAATMTGKSIVTVSDYPLEEEKE